MFCSKCGSKLPEGVKFCSVCGKSVDTVSNQAAASFFTPALDLDADVYESPVIPQKPAYEPTKAVKPITSDPIMPIHPNSVMPVNPIPPAPVQLYQPGMNSQSMKPVIPYRAKQADTSALKISAVIIAAALIIGGLTAFFEDIGASTSSAGGNRGNGSYSNSSGNHYSYNNYGSNYNSGYSSNHSGSSRIDCPACTGGRHSLCNGSGKYSNYGETVDCPCNGGTCNLCGGDGYR